MKKSNLEKMRILTVTPAYQAAARSLQSNLFPKCFCSSLF